MGLDITLMHRGCARVLFYDYVGLFEALRDVPNIELEIFDSNGAFLRFFFAGSKAGKAPLTQAEINEILQSLRREENS